MRAPRLVPLVAAAALVAAAVAPAEAHRLRLFATVAGAEISGHAFFVGGGRPADAEIVVTAEDGRELGRARTAVDGGFRWRAGETGRIRLRLDTGEGHAAETAVTVETLATAAVSAPAPTPSAAPSPSAPGTVADPSPSGLSAEIEKVVEAAVARQIRPLHEAFAEAEARVRFNDVLGGLGMIAGLGGVALWARGRRSGPEGG